MARETMPVGQASNKMVFEAINNSTAEVGRVVVPSSRIKIVEASLTRSTADTTVYAAGDVVSGSTATTGGSYLTFDDMAHRSGGSGTLFDAVAICSANQTPKPNQRLLLFDTPPGTTVLQDNLAWVQPTTDMRNLVAEIEFSAWSASGTSTAGNCYSHNQNVRAGYECVSTDDSLYGIVIERGSTYPPTAGERYDYRLKALRD